VKQLAELPPNLTLAQLQALLNDRIRDVNDILTGAVSNPAEADVDMAAHRITNLADPRDDLDAVTLRTLKRFSPAAPAVQAVPGDADYYAIVFDEDGALVDGETIPAYAVMTNRTGNPFECCLYSRVAAPGDVEINFGVLVPNSHGTVPVEQLLMQHSKDFSAANLVLKAGQTGPVFFTPSISLIFGVASFPRGTIIYPKIISGSSATICTMEVGVKR
jgi:hypothetical protein